MAELTVDVVKESVNLKLAETNDSSFLNYPASLKALTGQIPWIGCSAKQFREFFAGTPGVKPGAKHNVEHHIESQWLTQLSMKTSKGKYLPNIQPVKLLGQRFQMPTPLRACEAKTAKITYAIKGGGIDILARHGKGKGVNLAVVELKDECLRSEPPEKAIRQAIAYATFLRFLLRKEEAGAIGWWRLFGFNGPVPKKLGIKAVIAMPTGPHSDTSFAKQRIAFENSEDFIELHFIYFNVAAGTQKITAIAKTSLT